MVKENRDSYKVTHIKVNIKMEDLMVLVHIGGLLGTLFMRVPSKMDLDTVKVNGRITKPSTLGIMQKDSSKDTESSICQVGIFTKETL